MIREINQAGCTLLQTEGAPRLGHPFVVLVSRVDRPAFLDHMRRCRQFDGGIVETELSIEVPGRGTVPVRLYTRPVMFDNGVCWTILIDLTERVRLEEARIAAERERERAERQEQAARMASEAKDRFLAMLSHELRTPLTPALFAACRLLDQDIPDHIRRFADVIKRNVEIEARLINDLLDVTRIVRGRFEVELAVVDVEPIIRECVDICAPSATARHVTVTTAFEATSHHVRGDDGRLRQVFWNLLANAIKFTDGGTVDIRTTNDESQALRVTFADTGIGMDQDRIQHLFSPFERVELENQSRSGLGLGLAICKGIIDAHGGSIWASSRGIGM